MCIRDMSKHGTDLNKAMLAAFAVNSTQIEDTVIDQDAQSIHHKRKSVVYPSSRSPYGDFDWLK